MKALFHAIAVPCVCCLVVIASNTASAQTMNLDYHDGRGVPQISFSAAGAPGNWNALLSTNTTSGVPRSLFNVDGVDTGVTIMHTNLNFFVTPVEISGTTGQKAFLGDYAGSVGPPLHLDFNGLANGLYSVFTYMVGRQDIASGRLQNTTLNDDPSTLRSATGLWNGNFISGQTHAYHEIYITDHKLRVTVSGLGDPILNGVQLVHVIPAPEPSSVALLIAGVLAYGCSRWRTAAQWYF
jgi:hypothetical protein